MSTPTRAVHDFTEVEKDQFRAHKALLLPVLLEEVNAIRLALAIGEGKLPELPRGVPRNAEQCVLAKALSNGWTAKTEEDSTFFALETPGADEVAAKAVTALTQLGFEAYEGEDYGSVTLIHTWTMEWFVRWYDDNQYPELVLGAPVTDGGEVE